MHQKHKSHLEGYPGAADYYLPEAKEPTDWQRLAKELLLCAMCFLVVMVLVFLSGCTYNTMIFEKDLQDVSITQTTDKTVSTSPEVQANLPVSNQGGQSTVSNPQQQQTNPK